MSLTPRGAAPLAPFGRRYRVVFCTSGGLHGSLVLLRLMQCPDLQVAGVVRSSRILSPRYGYLRGALEQLRRSGPAYAFYLWCSTSLSDCLCAMSAFRSVELLARLHRIPLYTTRDINDDLGIDFLARLDPDLLVSAFFNQRVSPAVLRLPRIAALNIHPSLLPEFKGVDPVFYAQLRQTARLGVTVHHMAPDLDSGNVVAQAGVRIAPGSTVFGATAALFAQGARMLVSALPDVVSGGRGDPQGTSGSYDTWPRPEDVRRLGEAGTALVRPRDMLAIPAQLRAASRSQETPVGAA